jgi:hypothetical protein
MNLEVRRQAFTPNATLGQLFIDGELECVTLEPVRLPIGDVRKPRAIPPGTYNVSIRWSTKFGKHVPHVENVPNFVAIEIHCGNSPKDTDGCTLVGTEAGPGADWISHSIVAWTHLMSKMMAAARLLNLDQRDEKALVWDVGQITYTS